MQQYRGFIKARTNIGYYPISSSQMKITSATIKRDLLTKATSDFQLLNIPSAVTEGDIFGVYNDNGKIVYIGVISKVSDTIQCDQMTQIFDDEWLYNVTNQSTLEATLKNVIDTQWRGSDDPIIQSTFEPFNVVTTTETTVTLPTQDANTTMNFSEWLYQLYSTYGIIVDFDVPFSAEENGDNVPTITIGRNQSVPILLANNAIQVLSVVAETQVTETNKLVIYSKGDEKAEPPVPSEYRATYYATPNGITTNKNDGSRLSKVNTVYEFSDDPLDDIVKANLSDDMYNHEIHVTLAMDGKLYDFWDFKLGQPFEIYYGKYFYQTVLTGYSWTYQNFATPTVELTFGKVRLSLESIIYKQINGKR